MHLSDGRTLAWAEYGDPRGAPVFYFHGGGASLIEAACFDREARTGGIRLIAPSRPGCLHSTARPGMRPIDFASDCAELATHLGIARFVTTGNSNGGLFTMAVAHQLTDRVIGAVPINSTSPIYDPAVWRLTPWSLKAVMRFYGTFPGLFLPVSKLALKGDRDKLFPKEAEPEIVEIYVENVRSASQASMVPELRIASRPWGFDHRAIKCPTRILYGEQDWGRTYGRHWATEMANGRYVELPGGHVPIAPEARRMLVSNWLAVAS